MSAVPYENLTVQLGESGPLDVEVFAERILSGRGGYCFEVNGVFAVLMEELGFHVDRHESVVGLDGPTNHLGLVASVDGSRRLCEAGFGEGWMEPLPFEAGRHELGPFAWTISEVEGGWWVEQHRWGSAPGIRISSPVVGLDAFAPHHERLSTSPDSRFVKTLVCQQIHDDRIVSLRARTVGVRGPDVDTKTVLADEAEFAEALRREFRITLDPARIARLWQRACEQHETFLRERAAA